MQLLKIVKTKSRISQFSKLKQAGEMENEPSHQTAPYQHCLQNHSGDDRDKFIREIHLYTPGVCPAATRSNTCFYATPREYFLWRYH